MKKIYLSLFLFGISVVSYSQSTKRAQSHRAIGDHSISVLKNRPAERPGASANVQNKIDYLTENFEGVFPPAGWTVNSGPLSSTTNPDQDWHKEDNGGYPENSVAFSTTSPLSPGGCASILYVNSTDTHDENLISPVVALPNSATRVIFNFATSYYWHVSPFDNADVQFSISTDGGTNWTVLWQEDDQAMLDASGSAGWYDGDAYGWFEAMFDLTSYAGQSVTFKFNYSGIDGAPFYIDNFVIQDIPANDLKIMNAYTSNVFTGFDYSIIPLMQVTELTPGIIVKNGGSASLTNVPVTAVINDGTTDVYTGSQNVSLNPGETDTLWFASGITPSTTITYNYTFTLPNDDDNTNNLSDNLTNSISNDIYAHDSTDDGGVGFDNDAEYSWGCIYEVVNSQTLKAANVLFGQGTTATQVNVFLSRFSATDAGANVQAMDPVYDFVYSIPSAAINSGSFAVIPFPQEQILEAGYYYVLEIRKDVGTERLYIGSSNQGDEDAGTVSFGPWGANDAVNYYTGWNVAMAIRMNFGTLPVENVTFSQNIATLCPNHSNVTLTGGSPAGGTYSGVGVVGNAFSPTTAGIGTHTITYSYYEYTTGATGSTTFDVIVDACAGIEEGELANIAIYPNPTTGKFTVTNTENVNSIELVDQLGRTLASWKVNQVAMNLDVTKIAQGNYTLVFKGDNSSSVRQVQIAK